MSYCYDKSLGGCKEKQNHSHPVEPKTKRKKSNRDNDKDKETESYIQRLRPRPTRRTERYNTSTNTQLLSRQNSTPIQKLSGKSSVTHAHTNPRTKVIKAKVDRASHITASSFKNLDHSFHSGHSVIKTRVKNPSPSRSVSDTRKLDFHSDSGQFSGSLSSNSSAVSQITFGKKKSSARTDCIFSKTLKDSLKEVENLSPTVNCSPCESFLSESEITTSGAKTGSCASNRRGSEQSGQGSEVVQSPNTSVQSETECRHTSNRQLMPRLRQASGNEEERRPSGNRERVRNSSSRQPGNGGGEASSDSAVSFPNTSGESDDHDITRLQALLESRGLPPRLFSSLGPRMQHILHRSVGTSINLKTHQYMQGIQAEGDESQQLQSAIGMCQLLVMGNEDTLAGFPVKTAVPALTNLLKMEHNFDLMHHACRALTYMMEALPHSSGIVVDAIPVMLDKLQTIQCIDVAEQTLAALDIISKRHASTLLAAGGLSSCLLYIDFFSLPAQRSALSVAANCCSAVSTLSADFLSPVEQFERYVSASLSVLSSKLAHHDKKCVESVCLCFVRLIDGFQQDPNILSEIAAGELLQNFQQLLVITPPILTTGTLVLVIRSMTMLCYRQRSLASELLNDNISETLRYLLCGNQSEKEAELAMARSSQEMLEITCFIEQLLPRLPSDDPLFSVNCVCHPDGVHKKKVIWQWKDEDCQWQSFIWHDSRILEMAYNKGDKDAVLYTDEHISTVNFETMHQMDDLTNLMRSVQRIVADENEILEDISEDTNAAGISHFVQILFPIVSKVYDSSAGYPPVRHACLHSMNQMVYFSNSEWLLDIVCKMPLSSQISAMLSNPDTQIIVNALQLAELLMRKLPDTFAGAFRKDGIVHQVENLASLSPAVENTSTARSGVRISKRMQNNRTSSTRSKSSYDLRRADEYTNSTSGPKASSSKEFAKNSSASDKAAMSRPSRVTKIASSFFTNFSPTAWGRTLSSALGRDGCATSSALTHNVKREDEAFPSGSKDFTDELSHLGCEILRRDSWHTEEWIRNRAQKILNCHFKEARVGSSSHLSVIDKLAIISSSLGKSTVEIKKTFGDLCDILSSVEVSPFEVIQSGIVSALLNYLTTNTSSDAVEKKQTNETFSGSYDELNDKIRIFLSVCAGLPICNESTSACMVFEVQPLLNLVGKLNQCLGRLEQFPVKSRKLMSDRTHILHVLTTRQLKCQLQRHPECRNTKRWLGSPIKVDPLLQMRAIERYLLMKGYGSGSSNESSKKLVTSLRDDDDASENDFQGEIRGLSLNAKEREGIENEANFSAHVSLCGIEDSSHFSGRKKRIGQSCVQRLEFYVNNRKIPSHMTVYQALEQYGPMSTDLSMSETSESCFSFVDNISFWNKTHMIQYKLEKEEFPEERGSSQSKTSRKVVATRRLREQSKSPLLFDGIIPDPVNPLHKFLVPRLPHKFAIADPSIEVLCLLRVIHAICKYWFYLYPPYLVQRNQPLIVLSEFVSNEINAKCVHQLEDPLIIITGQISTWIKEIAEVCPFVMSFETRQLLFKVTAFERDRAMQHLLDTGLMQTLSANMSTGPNDSHSSTSNHFVPRIEKVKCSVSRKNLLHQAEKVITEHGHSRAMIEVDYEGEVGTGLGPTLEFFTLTSKELQNSVQLWREDSLVKEQSLMEADGLNSESTSSEYAGSEKLIASSMKTLDIKMVKGASGLFPSPIGFAAKHSYVMKIMGKFHFLGRFLAKALLDGRLVDIPLSIPCYKWLLGEESTLTGLDLEYIDPELSATYRKFCKVIHERELIMRCNPDKLGSLEMDGCLIEDLGLDFCLPGYPKVELIKMGKNTPVTAYNLDKYIRLIPYWTLFEGVKHQMNALKDGFESVLHLPSLCFFYAEELDQLFCGSKYQPWGIQELIETSHPDHGYTQDSSTVKALYRILASYNVDEQRDFLQFVTGCPHLPVGGLRALNPPLTVVRKACDGAKNADDYLPSVMTCLNYLKLPEYSTEEIMRSRLRVAVQEGQKSFLLS